MKEDKLDKEIAASLKEKLVEASVPYKLGAWEGFQKKRAQRKRKAIAYWASGIAASLLLLAVGINSVGISGNENASSTEVQLAENTVKSPEKRREEFPATTSEAENSPAESIAKQESNSASSDSNALAKASENKKSEINPNSKKALASIPERAPKTSEKVKGSAEMPVTSAEKAIEQTKEKTTVTQSPLIAKTEKVEIPFVEKSSEETLAVAKVEELIVPAIPAEKDKFVAESDFPEIEKDKTTIGLGMGLSPGFGAIQSDNQVATAQTIGLGMLVDIKLPGKFTLGSGLGLNYLNQNNEQESTVMAFGNSYPKTEKLEVRQMQVEVPVFVKYPVTKNNSISVQAGFSNYYALNESASQENTTAQQSAFYANDAMGSSSVSLRQESVTETANLESKSGKFYPFATLNFGVNLRVLETKGANYVIMPFYNYQLKQVSGYGDTYGLFGASFKMNFGGKEK